MHVLIAPQEFKGSLSADEAALAISRGLRAAHPDWRIDMLPLSDGGPGFLDAIRRAMPAEETETPVHDALGRPVMGRWIRIRESGDAVIEAVQANGLFRLGPNELDCLNADTAGVGELIRAAAMQGPGRIVIGVGGSATTDGGAGAARAMGARFLDDAGRDLPPGGAALTTLARIEWRPPEWVGNVDIVVATDVTNPLLGRNGAATVYGPQKGADAAQVEILEAALTRYSAVLSDSLGVDVARLTGGGAAGGLAAGLVAFLGARIESGFGFVAEITGLRPRIERCDLIVTGEGSFDGQSQQGKVTGSVLEMARAMGKPAVVFAGRATGDAAQVRTLLAVEPDGVRAMREAAELLMRISQDWAAEQH